MKKVFLFACLLATAFIGCSDDDDGTSEEGIWEITMTVDIPQKETIQFEIYNADVTSATALWGDGTEKTLADAPHVYEPGQYDIIIRGRGEADLGCINSHIISLDVSKCPELDELVCGGNELTSLDVTNNTKLRSLSIANTYITSIDLSRCTDLRIFDCSNASIPRLDLSANKALEELNCHFTFVENLQFPSCKNLRDVDLGYTNLSVDDFNAIYELLPDWTDEEQGTIVVGCEGTSKTIAVRKNWKVTEEYIHWDDLK